MKRLLTYLALLFFPVLGHATVTYFYAPGGDFDRTDTVTLTQTGRVYVQAGGSIASNYQADSGATIWIDGTQVMYSDHSVRDGSQTAVMAVYEATLPAGAHTVRTSVVGTAAGGANNTFAYIELEDESGPLNQSTINQITALYQSADDQLRSDLTTIIQNTQTELQNQIDATNGNVTQLQQNLTALTQQVATLQSNQSADEAAIAQLQQQIAADQAAIATLQSQAAAQQAQLQTLTDLEQSHVTDLQSQVNALSSRVSTLSSTTVRKSNLNTYLLYGGAGLGAGALGVGLYSLFDQPSAPGTSTPKPSSTHAK